MKVISENKFKIIIVDDDALITFIIQKMVQKLKLPLDLMSFSNGKEGETYFLSEESQNTKNLLLLDLNMPIMNGWQMLDSLNEKNATHHIEGHILTSSVSSGDKIKSKNYPFLLSFIEKPIEMHVLERITNDFLDRLKD